MAGETENIDAHLLHINGEHPRRLGCVHDEEKAVTLRNLSHPRDVHHISREVRPVGRDNRPRLRTDEGLEFRVVGIAFPVCLHKGQRYPLLLHLIKGAEHRIVLQHRGDDVVPGNEDSLDGDIQGLRGIAGKYHLLRILCIKKFCQKTPGLIHGSRCLEGCLVSASARIAHRLHG